MSRFQPPRGTRDFLPEEMARRRAVSEKIRKVFEAYGYGEVWTPAFEDFELLAKKSGPQIEEEIYAFTDKSGRKLGLRFDPTVPICRIVASNPALPKPVKFYYITNMWRYDNPGAGRWREFWQAGAELIGPSGTGADAEMLALVSDSLKAVGIKEFYFRISSRKIVDAFIKKAGIPDGKKNEVFRSIDKLDKIGESGVKAEMRSRKIPDDKIEKLLELIRSKKAGGKESGELEEIKKSAKEMGAENIQTDLSIVRGIDYYTGFVFETFVKGCENLGSVASGGRYDSLIGVYSGKDTPATGFGIGIDRLMEVVKGKEMQLSVKLFVAPVKEEARIKAMELTQQIRKNGISAETDLMGRDLRKQLEYAGNRGIPYALIVGPKEIGSGRFTLRDMKTGKEESLSLDMTMKRLK